MQAPQFLAGPPTTPTAGGRAKQSRRATRTVVEELVMTQVYRLQTRGPLELDLGDRIGAL
jgi:hypothetical protein